MGLLRGDEDWRPGEPPDAGFHPGGEGIGRQGVAAIVSDGPWMAGKGVFERNGFVVVAEADRFQLVAHRLAEGPLPFFRDISENLEGYQSLHVVYSAQCPMVPKSVNDLSVMAMENGLELKVSVLTSAAEARNAPSYYGTFNLIWNGRLLSDHYVSRGRFKGLLKEDSAGVLIWAPAHPPPNLLTQHFRGLFFELGF